MRDEQIAPPRYIQGLINTFISDIQIICINLILRYVEDDLVQSLIVRTASFSPCNGSWKPAFTELSMPDLIMEKELSVYDLTICLARTGAMGLAGAINHSLLVYLYALSSTCWRTRWASPGTRCRSTRWSGWQSCSLHVIMEILGHKRCKKEKGVRTE